MRRLVGTFISCLFVGCTTAQKAAEPVTSSLVLRLRLRPAPDGGAIADCDIANVGHQPILVGQDVSLGFRLERHCGARTTVVDENIASALPIQRQYVLLPSPRHSGTREVRIEGDVLHVAAVLALGREKCPFGTGTVDVEAGLSVLEYNQGSYLRRPMTLTASCPMPGEQAVQVKSTGSK